MVHGENVERSNPVEGKLGLTHRGVGVCFGPLVDSGRGVVDPCPVAYRVRGAKVKVVHDEVVAVGQA